MCVEVLLRGKRHEDLPSGSEKRGQGEGVCRRSFSGEKKKKRPAGELKGGRPQMLRTHETYEYKLCVQAEQQETALLSC